MPGDGGVGAIGATTITVMVPPDQPMSMLLRFGCALVVTLVGIAVLIRFRKRLPALVVTRTRRIFVEVVILGTLQIVVAIFIGAVDLRGALAGKIAPEDNRILWGLPFAGAAAVLFQAFSVLRADTSDSELAELRTTRDTLDKQLTDARAQRNFFTIVSQAFLRVVSHKRERLKGAKNAEEGIKALQPTRQGMSIIMACWEIFDKMINPTVETHHRVRVAYFRANAHRLDPMYCWNGDSASCVSVGGWSQTVTASFSFAAMKGCVARSVSLSGETRWIPDAEAADKDSSNPFFFFDYQTEYETLKSMVVVPVRLEGEGPKYDVVSIDTSCKGYFNAPDRSDEVLHIVQNMAHRLHLEKEMERVIGGGADA
jgi:hypothetical protein